jgi:hypothetical protein
MQSAMKQVAVLLIVDLAFLNLTALAASLPASPMWLTIVTAGFPKINAQPRNQTVIAGQSATFTMPATGDLPLSYQWTFNGLNVGSSSSTYTRSNCQLADNGGRVQVTVSNASGSVQSSAAILTAATPPKITDLVYAPAPIDNPLKGLAPSYTLSSAEEALFPHSMEYANVSFRDLMTGPTSFVWTSLDAILNLAATNGCQCAVRVYMDFPGKSTSEIPQYLLDGGLTTYAYTDYGNVHSLSPDYEDANLRTALTNFIAALGARYDNDPRLACIELGLLGFWGQWGTWPSGGTFLVPFASTNVQAEVLSAYVAAFPHTKLLLPEPYKDGVVGHARTDNLPLGYHDDMFADHTIGLQEWQVNWFSNLLWAADCLTKWQTQMIGGEISPGLASCIWDSPTCSGAGNAFDTCVQSVHATWMLTESCFRTRYAPNTNAAARARALASVQKMGYEFQVMSLSTWTNAGSLMAGIRIKNTGVAPFYYDWPIELAAATSGGQILRRWSTPWVISAILPGSSVDLQTTLLNPPPSGFTLLMRVINPLPSGKPLRFANTSQDATLPGWLTLGVIQ